MIGKATGTEREREHTHTHTHTFLAKNMFKISNPQVGYMQ